MKVLITGSKGFIGSHLLIACKTDFETWGCDVVVDYEAEQYLQISAVNSDFHKVFLRHPFDVCINASGAASVPASLEEPLKDFELNTANVYKLLDAIRQYNPNCKFINLSSAAVYGNPAKLPVSETFDVKPISPYGIHKMQAEEICKSFYTYWNIPTCSLRIFSAYGPGLKKQLFWDLYKKSLNQEKIELFGTGNETRDFIYIDDITNAVLLIIKSAAFKGEAINIANGKQWKITDAANMFLHASQWKGDLLFTGKTREGDPLCWEADISTITAMGYQQTISMQDGILKYATWLKERK